MADLNIILANDDQLKEIWVSLKSSHMMLQSYNQYCVNTRNTLFEQGEKHLVKEVEESMKESKQ